MNTASTHLPVPAPVAIPAFRSMAESWELSSADRDGALVVTLDAAEVLVRGEAEGTRVQIDAVDAATLQMLRDLLTEQFAEHGLAPAWEGARTGRYPANLSLAVVTGVERISPSYTRVTLEGPELARFATGGLHFRLLFGPEGAGWPEADGNGVTQWPGGMAAWHRPVYTTREIICDGRAARLSFDVFLHAGGRVSTWTESVVAGEEIALTGPGGDARLQPSPWQAWFGDETALPAIARKLAAAAPDTLGEAVILVPDAGDIQALGHPEGVMLRWLLRDKGEPLADAVADLNVPDGPRHIFFAAEKAEAEAARELLVAKGLEKREFVAATYWIRG